jgi:molecular chaperone Hsp33
MPSDTTRTDEVRRFIVENLPLRGHWVRLGVAWRELREHRDYPPAAQELLGQAVSASVLLAASLKFRGSLTLQLQGNGTAGLLVAQCTHDYRVRALARIEPTAFELATNATEPLTPELFRHLVGSEGRLAVTVEADERAMRYQGIVPLAGSSFSECLETYFASSEQLPTRVRLAADGTAAAGILLQRLPESSGGSVRDEVDAVWEDAGRGLDTLSRGELLRAPVEGTLSRSFARHDVRLFAGAPVRFECRCGSQQVTSVLRAFGADEMQDLLREQGAVTVTCDFCNRPYRFDAVDIAGLFATGATPEAPKQLQ